MTANLKPQGPESITTTRPRSQPLSSSPAPARAAHPVLSRLVPPGLEHQLGRHGYPLEGHPGLLDRDPVAQGPTSDRQVPHCDLVGCTALITSYGCRFAPKLTEMAFNVVMLCRGSAGKHDALLHNTRALKWIHAPGARHPHPGGDKGDRGCASTHRSEVALSWLENFFRSGESAPI